MYVFLLRPFILFIALIYSYLVFVHVLAYPETFKALPLRCCTQDVSFESTGLYKPTIFVFEMRGEINVKLHILLSTVQLAVSLQINYS